MSKKGLIFRIAKGDVVRYGAAMFVIGIYEYNLNNVDRELAQEIELVSRILHIPKVDWARNVLAHEVKRELEEHKSFIAVEYMRGNLSREELVKLLGKQSANDIDYIMKETREDLKAAKKLAKKLAQSISFLRW